MTIIQNQGNLNSNFTTVLNETLRDKRLSHGAIGLWVRLISNEPGWKITIEGLVTQYPLDRHTAVRSNLRELCKFKYLGIVHKERDKGRFEGSCLTLYHRPYEDGELTDEQTEYLFSKEFLNKGSSSDKFKILFPKAIFRAGNSEPENRPLRSTKEEVLIKEQLHAAVPTVSDKSDVVVSFLTEKGIAPRAIKKLKAEHGIHLEPAIEYAKQYPSDIPNLFGFLKACIAGQWWKTGKSTPDKNKAKSISELGGLVGKRDNGDTLEIYEKYVEYYNGNYVITAWFDSKTFNKQLDLIKERLRNRRITKQ